jgi:L-ribulose-5-phosphate 3-epimerase
MMHSTVHTRREFLRTGSAALALAALGPAALAAEEQAPASRPGKKAIMWGTVGVKGTTLEKMKAVKAAGFDGAEMNSGMDQDEVLRARDETGLEIPSVCGSVHWKLPLSDPDPKVREQGLAGLRQCLRDAKRYGAGSILLVPGKVGNGTTYDECWTRSIAEIRKAIPLAEDLGVRISIENVWNNFITQADEALRYLEAINSPWVGWHFDCGNVIRYGDPIAWIRKLGPRINRVHVKEYSLDRAMRSGKPGEGFDVPLLEGANNWQGIMQAFREIGYASYFITEQPGGNSPEGLKDLCERLGKILAL